MRHGELAPLLHFTPTGAVLMEQNDEWAGSRRYMEPGILAKVGIASASGTREVNAIEPISA